MIELWFVALALSAPLWIPMVFIAYAVGRGKFGLRFLLGLVTVEAVALAIFMAMWRQVVD